MHQHPYPPPALLHNQFLRRVLESPSLHQPEKGGRLLAPRVGEDGLTARREQAWDEVREGGDVAPLVEDVGCEDKVEASEAPRTLNVPVEEGRLRVAAQVNPGVVEGEVEGCLVVVDSENLSPASEGDDGGEPDAAAELDGALAGQLYAREVACQGDSARPELGPVREPLVALEVLLIKEGVGRGGMQDAVGSAPGLDERFGQPRAAAEVGAKLVWRAVYRPTEAASRAARPSRSAAASLAML